MLGHLGTLSLSLFLNAATGYLLEITPSKTCFLNPFLLLTCRAGYRWSTENKKKRDSVYVFAHFASKASEDGDLVTHAQ